MKKKIGIMITAVFSVVLGFGILSGCNLQTSYFSVSFLKNTPSGVRASVENMPDGIMRVEKGSTIPKPSKEPTLEGYQFSGWYKDGGRDSENIWDFDTDTVLKTTRLYAKWTAESELKCNVEFKTNLPEAFKGYLVENMPDKVEGLLKGSTLTQPVKTPYLYTVDYQATPPVVTVAEGIALFEGWFLDRDCQTPFVFGTAGTVVGESTELYAKWRDLREVDTYSVSFNGNPPQDALFAVENMPSVMPNIIAGETASRPDSEPTLQGYVFGGWHKEEDCLNEWDFDTDQVTQNTILYAKWTEEPSGVITYSVSFNANKPLGVVDEVEGLPADITDIAAGGTIAKPIPDPTLTGYVFIGWYEEAECINEWNFNDGTVDGPTTLYALWVFEE